MTEVVISGMKPYDGRYELDFAQEMTTREWGWMKRLAGYLPLAMKDDSFGDPEVMCVLAVIAMRRAGRIEAAEVPRLYERLLDLPFGEAVTIASDPEQAPSPPPTTPSSDGNASTSGTSSKNSSGSSDATRPSTGPQPSGFSPYAPPMSAN